MAQGEKELKFRVCKKKKIILTIICDLQLFPGTLVRCYLLSLVFGEKKIAEVKQ